MEFKIATPVCLEQPNRRDVEEQYTWRPGALGTPPAGKVWCPRDSHGTSKGNTPAPAMGKADLATLKSVWEELYSTGAGTEWDGERFVVRGNACFILETLRGYGLAPDLLRDIQEVFCDGDRGFVNGFNPNLRFSWGGRVMRGDPTCVWIIEATAD